MTNPYNFLDGYIPAGSGSQRSRRHPNTASTMNGYGIGAGMPGPPPGAERSRQYGIFLPFEGPQYRVPDLPILPSSQWNDFITNVGYPNDPYAVQDPMIFDRDHYTNPQPTNNPNYADSDAEPEGEEPYATRDNRNRLTRLQWNILQRCAARVRYIDTPIEKWTLTAIAQTYTRFATEQELAQLLAEQEGKTEPIPYRVRNANGEMVQNTANGDQFQGFDSADDDAEGEFFAQLKREISPRRAEVERLLEKATDVRINDELRPQRRTACYPCRRSKRACDKGPETIGACTRCINREGLLGKEVFDADLNCQPFRHMLPSGPGTWLDQQDDSNNWEISQQLRREQRDRGERAYVRDRPATNKAKKPEKAKRGNDTAPEEDDED